MIAQRELSREFHWLRVFVTGSNRAIGDVEFLLDNEPWPDGERIAASVDWELAEPMWAWRWFMVVVPR